MHGRKDGEKLHYPSYVKVFIIFFLVLVQYDKLKRQNSCSLNGITCGGL